jgi:dihydrofolate reductase
MNFTKLSIIAACTPEGVIGKDNKLPWTTLEGDLKRFQSLTMGKVLIMGRKTVDSLPGALKGREIIQVSRRSAHLADPDHPKRYKSSVTNIGAAVSLAATIRSDKNDEIFVAGGGEVYRWAWEHATKIYLTVAHERYPGNVKVDEFKDLLSGKDMTWDCIKHEAFADNDYYIFIKRP